MLYALPCHTDSKQCSSSQNFMFHPSLIVHLSSALWIVLFAGRVYFLRAIYHYYCTDIDPTYSPLIFTNGLIQPLCSINSSNSFFILSWHHIHAGDDVFGVKYDSNSFVSGYHHCIYSCKSTLSYSKHHMWTINLCQVDSASIYLACSCSSVYTFSVNKHWTFVKSAQLSIFFLSALLLCHILWLPTGMI